MKLIDKDALLAEINRIMNEQQEICKADVAFGKEPNPKNVEVIYQCQQLIKFINTFEVKEVDLDKEISDNWENGYELGLGFNQYADIAKHFFELGLKKGQKRE